MDLSLSLLEIENFKSFSGGPHRLAFHKHPLGLCYIRGENKSDVRLGSNGSGKSSLWDALTWCLYGKSPDGLRNPDIKPWFGGSSSRVSLEVVIDEECYTVTRSTNPNRLRINDKDVGQEEVEFLIGLNYDTFLNTILLGQGRDLFFDLDPAAKLQLFSDVLDLSRWEERSAQASKVVSDLNVELQSLENEHSKIQGKISQVTTYLDSCEQMKQEWEDVRQKELDEKYDELTSMNDQLQAFFIKASGLEVEEDIKTTLFNLLDKDHRNLCQVEFAKRDELSKALAKHDALRQSIAEVGGELEDLDEDGVCPTCGQDLKGTDLQKHIQSLGRKLEDLEEKAEALDIEHLSDQNKKINKKTSELKDRLNAEEKEIKKLRSEVEVWRKRASEQQTKVDVIKHDIQFLEDGANPYSKQVREARASLKELKKSSEGVDAKIKSTSTEQRRTKYWVKGFKDIRLLIMEEILQELEMVTTAMMQEVGLVDWYVKYDIEKETASGTIKRGLNLEIYNPKYGKPVKWKSWSGGESQRLRIIGSLALAEVLLNHAGVVPDVEILDEPIKNMGPEGVEDLCELLFDRSRSLERQVWYIDHQTIEGGQFDATVTIVKDEDRCSHILNG